MFDYRALYEIQVSVSVYFLGSCNIYQSLKYVLVCKYIDTISRGMFTNINTEPLFCPPPPVTMKFICSSCIYYRDIVNLKRLQNKTVIVYNIVIICRMSREKIIQN